MMLSKQYERFTIEELQVAQTNPSLWLFSRAYLKHGAMCVGSFNGQCGYSWFFILGYVSSIFIMQLSLTLVSFHLRLICLAHVKLKVDVRKKSFFVYGAPHFGCLLLEQFDCSRSSRTIRRWTAKEIWCYRSHNLRIRCLLLQLVRREITRCQHRRLHNLIT